MLRIGEINHFDERGRKELTRQIKLERSVNKGNLIRVVAYQDRDKEERGRVSIDMQTGIPRFAGIIVSPLERGQMLPHLLMDAAFKVAEILEMTITETTLIRKPLIAQFLGRYGFEPLNHDTVAEILPRSSKEDTVPKVRIETRRIDAEPGKDSWYQIQEGEIDRESGNPIVSIYSRYRLAKPDMAQAMRERQDIQENTRLRIFPNRVRAILDARID